MIPFDFSYVRPDSVMEAVGVFRDMDGQGRMPLYYGGGTEILSMARMNSLQTGAVIDVKRIPECRMCTEENGMIILGAALTLSEITESGIFPLLGKTAARIADHTIQCKLTLGGNLAGTIRYREAALPLLLSDCIVETYGPQGWKRSPFLTVFNQRMQLAHGEFIVRVFIPKAFAALPHVHLKKTQVEKIDYPVVTLCALRKDGRIRLAVSGVCAYPFRSAAMEDVINQGGTDLDQTASRAAGTLPDALLDDIYAGKDYRSFVLCQSIREMLATLGGG